MTPQPLPTNLHPSQCYRLLDHERDTLQDGDKIVVYTPNGATWLTSIHASRIGQKPEPSHTFMRPFTPPAPVQTQEFWRLLEFGEAMQRDDKFFSHGNDFVPVSPVEFGNKIGMFCRPVIRRVTVPVAAPAPLADAPKAEPSGDYAAYRERLFKYAEEKFGHTLVNSEMYEIEHIVLGYWAHKPRGPITTQPQTGPYLVSVDGHEAPTMEHATIEDARAEAERLATNHHPARVRLLRQVGTVEVEIITKWDFRKKQPK